MTIDNWTGTAGVSGTADRIFITASPSATFLNNVNFTGYQTGAIRLGTGEIVPASAAAGPTKLAITSVNGGSSPTAGSTFSVAVQAQDGGGTPQSVSADTAVTLSLNTGAGTLGGTLTGTITAGSSSVTISGVTYTKAESGVILTATRTSGDSLTAGNSSAFTVNPGAFTKLQLLMPGETAAPGSVSGKTGTATGQTIGIAFTVTVNAVDANWNVISTNDTVAITSSDASATLPANAALVAGTKTFSVTLNTAGTATVTASDVTHPAITANTGSSVTVSANTVGDYRTHQSGNWNSTTTWERWNGASWITPAPTTPVHTDGITTILNNHVVTITAAVTNDQVVVNAGGEIDVNAVTWTLNDGSGTDLHVYGIVKKNEGSTISGGQRRFRSGAKYIHNFQTSGGALTTATYDIGSVVEVIGYISNTAKPSNLNQPFADFVWNCPNQTGVIAFAGDLTNVTGTLTIGSSGSGSLVFCESTSPTAIFGNFTQTNGTLVLARSNGTPALNISGDFTLSGGKLSMSGLAGANTNGTGVATLKVGGDFSHTAGTLTEESSASGKGAIVFNGSGTQTFTSSGTVTNTIDFTVSSGSSLMLGTNLLGNGSSGAFTLSSGATLGIGHTNGIALSSASGNVRVTGTRSYNTNANYTYNASAAQVVGDGLPATVNNLTVDNSAGAPTGLTINGTQTINGNLYIKSGKLFRDGAACGGFGCRIVLKGNLTADAGTQLQEPINAIECVGTSQTITLSGVTADQGLGQLLVGSATSNPTVTLQTDVNAAWGLAVGAGTANSGTLNLNGKTLDVVVGHVTVNVGGTFLNTNGLLKIGGGFGPRTWTDNTGVQDFGAVSIGVAGGVLDLGSNIRAISVSVNDGTFNLSAYTLTLSTFTVMGGTVKMDTNNPFANNTVLVMNGGTFASQGYSDTLGTLTIQSNSTLLLGTNTTGALTFSNGSYTAGTLTISNWTGTASQSGTANRIFITTSPSTTFLANINFAGYENGAMRLGTGEIVPSGATGPTKLAITSVNGGSSPTAGTVFNVVVQAQDNGGTPRNVTANTGVSLSLNAGSGTLGGTLTGTITAGTSSVTISGVTYSKAESGVVLTVTRTSGDTLTAGNSSAFTMNTATVTVSSGLTANNKVYDGTTTARISSNNVVLSGVIAGDAANVSLSTNGYTASFGSATVGDGKTVTVGGLTLTGSAAGNYSLTQPSLSANITNASTLNALTSSLNPASTGSNVTFTATLSVVSPGAGTPTGNVIFRDGATPFGTNALNGSAVAAFSTSSLSHGSHTITAEYAGDGNFLGSTNSLNQVINNAPVAVTDILERYPTTGVKVRVSTLLTNDIDADADALTLSSVSPTSAAGGTVVMDGNWIAYAPPAGFTNSDSFYYVIADGIGLQATGSVSITIRVDLAQSQNVESIEDLGNGSFRAHFSGILGRNYTIQYAESLETPDWQPLGTATASAAGEFEFLDTPPNGSPPRFYRSIQP